MIEKIKEIEDERKRLLLGGGLEAIAKQHNEGKLTARERVERLLDPQTFQELDLWSAPLQISSDNKGYYPGDGVIVGYGEIDGRPVYVYSQDATVAGGTVATVHARKIVMVMERALKARVPIIGIVDSKGLRFEDAVESRGVFSYASMMYFQTLSSGVIPQIILIMGPCTEEAALSAALADFVFMVKDTSFMHIAPISEENSFDMGSAAFHSETTGCCDFIAKDDNDCLKKARELMDLLPQSNTESLPVSGKEVELRMKDEEDVLDLVPTNPKKCYDMRGVIRKIVDNGYYMEIKSKFAMNITVGLARLGGQIAGIVANNPKYLAGCNDINTTDKQVRFTRFCDAFNIPLIFLSDTPAFLPAVTEERRGIIRHGSKAIFANAEATVPKIIVYIRKGYGGGNLAMPGTTMLGSDVGVAWPTLERGLMGPEGVDFRNKLTGIF